MVNNERYRAAGPPDGGDHTDKDKDEEDIFDRADSAPTNMNNKIIDKILKIIFLTVIYPYSSKIVYTQSVPKVVKKI